MSLIYASPMALVREEIWTHLGSLGTCFHVTWIILGNFNQILDVEDKRGVSCRCCRRQLICGMRLTFVE